MRHLQRMQTGVAIAALVFVLTSATATIRQYRQTAVTAEDTAQTFASDCNVDLSRDPILKVYRRGLGNNTPLAAISQNTSPQLRNLEASLNNAAVVKHSKGLFNYTVVLYTNDGRVDRALAATPTGYVYDPQSKHCYRVKQPWVSFMSQVASKDN